jgi:hypothetical protein
MHLEAAEDSKLFYRWSAFWRSWVVILPREIKSDKIMKEKSKFYMDCHLAGRKYHEADLVWDRLRVGMPLRLEREADNRYDPEAVQVIFNSDGEDYLLGYIPRGDNLALAPFFDMGHDDLFDCRISRLNPETQPEQQVQLTINIRRKDDEPRKNGKK